jgi:hypothetical protein
MKRILFALMCAISIFSFSSCDNNKPENPQLEETALSVQQVGSNTTYSMNSSQHSLPERYYAVRELTKWHSDFLHTAFINLNNTYRRTTPLENITYNVNQLFDNYLVYLGEGESALVRDVNRFEETIEIYPYIIDEEEKAQLIVNLFPLFDTIVNTIPTDITTSNMSSYLRQEVFNTPEFQTFNVYDQNILLIMLTTYEDSYKYWTEHLQEIDEHFGSWHNSSKEMIITLAKADAAGAVGGLVTKGFRSILTRAGRAAIQGFCSGLLLGGVGAIPGALVRLSTSIGTEILCCAAGASVAKWIEKDRTEQEFFNEHMLMRPTYNSMLHLITPYLPE